MILQLVQIVPVGGAVTTHKGVLTTFEAADFCHTSYMSIKRWIWSGKLAAFKTPGGHFRVRKADLVDFMRGNGIPVPEDAPAVRRKILIVDGDEPAREELANFLRINGANLEIATAGDGYDTGMLMGIFKPDIVLLNLAAPGMDGLAICARLKKNPLTRSVMIIALAGSGREDAAARACGVERVLVKPAGTEALYDAIRSFG